MDEILAVLAAAAVPRSGAAGLRRDDLDDLVGHHGGPRFVFVNGAFDGELSDLELPAGVRFSASPNDAERADAGEDGFVVMNRAAAPQTAHLHVDAGTQVNAPLHIVHLGVAGDAATLVHPRSAVHVGRGGRATVIETFHDLAGPLVTNTSTRVVAGEGAAVVYRRVQAERADALHVGHTRIDISAGANVRATSVMTGAAIARSAVEAVFGGPDADLELDGLHVTRGTQRHDHMVTVDHAAPRCRSSQHVNGLIDDRGRGSFTGHVIVRPGAFGTDAYQSNRNMVLAPTAEADTRPWLEIFADDVRCAHGATVGRLDDEALFYLRSRGIPLAQSRALLVAAFTATIVDGLAPASLRDRVAAQIADGTTGGWA